MATHRRNPYVILGVDYGTPLKQARAAFAKLSRRLRRDPDAAFGLADATWALHEIERGIGDPRANLGIYRVPADPETYDYAAGDGAFALRPQELPARSTPEEIEAERHRLRAESAADHLLECLAESAD